MSPENILINCDTLFKPIDQILIHLNFSLVSRLCKAITLVSCQDSVQKTERHKNGENLSNGPETRLYNAYIQSLNL